MNAYGPDKICYNGKVITVNKNFDLAEAVAITGDKFVAVGSNKEVQGLAGRNTEQFDLGGKTVIPGLYDNHVHMIIAANPGGDTVNLFGARDLAEAYDRVQKFARKMPKGDWIFTSCYGWEHPADKGKPTRESLSKLVPDHPLYFRWSGVEFYFNDMAFKQLGIDESSKLGEGMELGKDGKPTGYFGIEGGAGNRVRNMIQERIIAKYGATPDDEIADGMSSMFPPPFRSPHYGAAHRREAILQSQALLNTCGVTSISEMGVWPEEFRSFQDVWANGELTVRANLVLGPPLHVGGSQLITDWIKAYSRSGMQGFGDDMLKIGGIKLVAGQGTFRGKEVEDTLVAGARYGWQMRIHHDNLGVSDGKMIFDTLKKIARQQDMSPYRHTLEHGIGQYIRDFGGMRDDEDWKFLAENNITIAANSIFLYFGDMSMREYYQDYKKHGVNVSNGSDYAAVGYETDHPLAVLYAAVALNATGEDPGQNATREDALRMSTINAAFPHFEEQTKGSIERGKCADMVVLSADYLTVPEKEILDIVVLETMVGGKTVYRRN